MATAQKNIKAAMRLLGLLAPGEEPTADEAQGALESLQAMLDQWSNSGFLVPVITTESFALTNGQASYTYGSGGDFNSTRPQEILGAYIRGSGGTDHPVTCINRERYNVIPNKGSPSLPQQLYFVPGYPLANVYLDNAPDAAYTLFLDTLKPLTTPAELTDSQSFPPGYDQAIRFNLAVNLAPEYGKTPDPVVVARADESLADLKRQNTRVPILRTEMGVRGTYNIYSDH